VAPDYAIKKAEPLQFRINTDAIKRNGCDVYFAAAKHIEGDMYQTVGTSRSVGLAAEAVHPSEATQRIIENIREHVEGDLEFRDDIGSHENIAQITQLLTK
jgi:phosphoribosylamine-glycine ligase